MSVRSGVRALEYALLAIAIGCLSWYGWRTLDIRHRQAQLTASVERSMPDVTLPPGPPADGIIGQLEIPRLHLSAPVTTGDDDEVLDFSVGYLPDTPLP